MADFPKWQQIDTAPKDGTLILLWCEKATEPSLARFDNGYWRNNHYGEREMYWHFSNPTHWMPLPPAPEKEPELPPIDHRVAWEKFKERFERDNCMQMTKHAWGKWVDALPRDEFLAMIAFGGNDK